MEGQFQRRIGDAPLFRQIKKLPFSAPSAAAVIMGIALLPAFVCLFGIPDDLWVGADQEIVSPTFQFLSTTGVDDFIILPMTCLPHMLPPFSNLYHKSGYKFLIHICNCIHILTDSAYYIFFPPFLQYENHTGNCETL